MSVVSYLKYQEQWLIIFETQRRQLNEYDAKRRLFYEISLIIIYQIFSLARDWLKHVT